MSQAQNTNSASVSGLDNLSYLNQSGTAQTLTVKAERVPKVNDRRYKIGTIWIDTTTNQAFILTSITNSNAQWGLASAGGSDLDTLTGDSGGPISPTLGNINILGGTGLEVNGSGSTLTIENSAVSGFPITPYVVGAIGEAGFQTVQSAIDAATAAGGGVVYIQPGTFTENLALAGNVSLVGTSFTDVTITGVHSLPSAGTILVQNLTLTTATHIFSSVTAGTTALTVEQCNFTVTDGFVFFLENWTGPLTMDDCRSIGGQDGVIRNSGGAPVLIKDSTAGSGGAGSSNVLTYEGGTIIIEDAIIDCRSEFNTASILLARAGSHFNATIDMRDDSIGTFTGAAIITGGSDAIIYNSSGTLLITESTISSTGDAISGSGAGVLKLGSVSFTDDSTISSQIFNITFLKQTGGNTPYVVGGTGIYTTIQEAINDADVAGGGVVQIHRGSYVENLTLADKVCLQGVTEAVVEITGTHTPPTSGNILLENLTLITTVGSTIDSAVAGTTDMTLDNCISRVTDGYLLNIPNWNADITVTNLISRAPASNNGFINNTSTSLIIANSCDIGDGGGKDFISTGIVLLTDCIINIACDFTGTLLTTVNCLWSTTVTLTGNTRGVFSSSIMFTGSQTAIVMNSAQSVLLTDFTIDSSASPVISGTGTGPLELGNVTFIDNDEIASAITTHRPATFETGAIKGRFLNITGDEITFTRSPLMQSTDDKGDKPSGTNGSLNLMDLGQQIIMEQFLIGNAMIIAPRMNSTGLLASLDLTATDGVEYNFGAARTNSRHAFTIGTSNAFFMELELIVDDVSGCEPCYIGFRKVQANSATYTSYTDFAAFGLQDTVNTGTAIIQTRLNAGGVVSTNTTDTWADASTHTIRIDVDVAGEVTYLFDGVAPTATAAFTFDNADVVVPFIHQVFGTTSPAPINWISMKVGFLN